MEKEYLRLYKHYSEIYGPNTCIFLMVGKFYEMYDRRDPDTNEFSTSMVRAVEMLNIQLSEPDPGRGKHYYFAGVPEQSLHKYAAVLTKQNWTVIVVDQVKENGKVINRQMARVLSPGTHFETATEEAPYVASIWMEEADWESGKPPIFGITFFDLTTGFTTGFQGETTGTPEVWSADTLVQAVQIHNPREMVVFWRGGSVSKPSETLLRSRLGGTQALLHIRMANAKEQGAFDQPFVRQDYLKRIYNPETMLPVLHFLHLQDSLLIERSLIGLLRFIEDHIPSSLKNLQPFQPWTPSGRVHLGNNALSQLNLSNQRIEDSVLGLFQKTITSPGKRGLRARLLTPVSDAAQLNRRLTKIEQLQNLAPDEKKQLERYLRQIYDFPRIHRRLLTYSITAMDVLQLEQTYDRMKAIAVLLNHSHFALTSEQFGDFLQLQRLFGELFDVNKARQFSDDIWFFQDVAGPKTAKVERELATLKKGLEDKVRELCEWVGLPEASLKVEVGSDNQAYFITGPKKDLNILKTKLSQRLIEQKPDNKVISVSIRPRQDPGTRTSDCPLPDVQVVMKKTAGGTVETPYLDELHGKVIRLREQLKAAAAEEMMEICRQLRENGSEELWDELEEWITDVDVSFCIGRVAEARGFVKPTILEDGEQKASLVVEGLRHPLIENTATRIQYVQHSVNLGATEEDSVGWLVYGMNASGKSSLMKAVGIAVILAQCGCYVPATKMVLRPFRSILTRILNQDNLWAGLSSFAVEMTELRDILLRADSYSLVLGDELCSGTESVSATALVASGIQHLLNRKSRFIFATHLHGLMDLSEITESKNLGIWHLKVHYDAAQDLLVYDRSLHKGPGSSRYGIEVAKALHVPTEFLETALKIRRKLLGEKVEEEAETSSWNSQVLRKQCEVCGHSITTDLEVHHIRQRSETSGAKHFADGSARDALSNLIVVCSVCHDKHHAGKLDIGHFVQTSMGTRRTDQLTIENTVHRPQTTETKIRPKSKWTEEQERIIVETLQKNPKLPLKALQFLLEKNHEIKISVSSLEQFRKS